MKKHLIMLIIGVIVFLTGITCVYIEIKDYKIDKDLSSNFEMNKEEYIYEMNDNKKYNITNYNSSKNIGIYIDNTLEDKIKIVVSGNEYLEININNLINRDGVSNISFTSDYTISFDSVKNIIKMGLETINNKTLYNYNLLKQLDIKVYVHDDYKDNIDFIYGEVEEITE